MTTGEPGFQKAPSDESFEEGVRETLRSAVAGLNRQRRLLEDLVRRLPAGAYAEGTDEPLDLPAAWRGLIEATVQDELGPAIDCLEHASRITSDPATWYRHG